MTRQQAPQATEPLFRPRDYIRLLSLVVAAGFILWAMMKSSDPRSWQWIAVFQRQPAEARIESEPAPQSPPDKQLPRIELQSATSRTGGILGLFALPAWNPAAVDAGILAVFADEFVPLDVETPESPVPMNRSAPTPERNWITGAIDHEVFLDEDDTSQALDPKRRDADARYHLLALAKEATLQQLAADARSDIRHSALLSKPRDYRGAIVRVKGDLLWVQTFELQRPTPGMEFVYQGLMVVPGTGQSYGILFTDLPEHMPPERLWSRLYLRNVTFDGYFLKVLKVQIPASRNVPARIGYIPVLVGKSPIIPEPPPAFDVFGALRTIGVVLAVVLIVGTVAMWLYRRSERRYLAKMAEIRARHRPPALPDAQDSIPFPEANAFSPPRRGSPPEPSEN